MRAKTIMAIAASSLLLFAIASPVAYADPGLRLRILGPNQTPLQGFGVFVVMIKGDKDQCIVQKELIVTLDGNIIVKVGPNGNVLSTNDPALFARFLKIFSYDSCLKLEQGVVVIGASGAGKGKHELEVKITFSEDGEMKDQKKERTWTVFEVGKNKDNGDDKDKDKEKDKEKGVGNNGANGSSESSNAAKEKAEQNLEKAKQKVREVVEKVKEKAKGKKG